MLRIALITDTNMVTSEELSRMAPALEENALHMWRAWRAHLPHWVRDAPPSVVCWDDGPGDQSSTFRTLPSWLDDRQPNMCPVYFVDSQSINFTTLAVHYAQGLRPAAKVHCDNATGLNTGDASIVEAASHEILEMLLNPYVDQWPIRPGRPGQHVAMEVCDPVQDTYAVTVQGAQWQCSNFVLPAWFGLGGFPALDYRGSLDGRNAGDLGPHGYCVLRDSQWRLTYEFGSHRDGFGSRKTVANLHPLARTRQLVDVCEMAQGRSRAW